jgi:hypothetical protein
MGVAYVVAPKEIDNSRVVQNLMTSTMPEGASHAVQF